MHVQILASGSLGNSALVRAGEIHLLLDAGLPIDDLEARLDEVRVSPRRVDAIALTHGHLDHARSAGLLAKKTGARVFCCERLMKNASVRQAPTLSTLRIGTPLEVTSGRGLDRLELLGVKIPHDADPTVALRIEHEGRILVLITDMGRADSHVARLLAGAHVLILEFNHDVEMLRNGPYPPRLKRRVGGDLGHLSNDEAAQMVRWLAGPALHTLILAHLSARNNTPERALAAARHALSNVGRADVDVRVADQDRSGPNLRV